MKKPVVSPSFLKQKARQLKKEKSLSQHEALNEASKQLGYTNYKHYLNYLESSVPEPRQATEGDMHALWLDKKEEMSKRLFSVEPLFENFKISFPDLFNSLREKRESKVSVQSICEKSALKEYLELYFLIDALRDDEGDIDDYTPYHIARTASLKNLIYKFKKDKIFVEGEYDLVLEFGFDYDKNDKHPTFEDEKMFGSFEIEIDESRKITVGNLDIGHYI